MDNHYGADTNWRRNKALLKRKELKDNKSIVKGFVKFPARLMVMYTDEDEDYTMHEDFSNIEVIRSSNPNYGEWGTVNWLIYFMIKHTKLYCVDAIISQHFPDLCF